MQINTGSIKRNIFSIVLITSSLILLFSSLLFSTYQYQSFKQELYQDLDIQSQILGANSQAVLLFDDKVEAQRVLNSLQYDQTIEQAMIISFDKQPHILAQYQKFESDLEPVIVNFEELQQKGENAWEAASFIAQAVPIIANNKKIGSVVLFAGFTEFYQQLKFAALIIVAVFIICFLIALWFSFIFSERLSRPILQLMQFMRQVSDEEAYDSFYTTQSFDEINHLSATLNHLLANMNIANRERDAAQQSLMLHNSHLTDEVFTRTKELELATKKAESASEAKSVFLANMSHEVRTPMNAILGFSKVLQNDVDSAQQKKQLSYVIDSANLLMEMMNDMLDFSRIEANKITLQNEPFILAIELTKIYQIIIAKADNKDLRILFELDPEINELLTGDSLRLKQVLLNLLINAVKFTEKGSVRLVIKLLASIEGECKIEFSVYDTGMGISLDKQVNLFDPFSQVDTSITREFGGAGLGLSICDKLIHTMGGELTVVSFLNRGSHFKFTLNFQSIESHQDVSANLDLIAEHHESVLILEPFEAYADYLKQLVMAFEVKAEVCHSVADLIEQYLMTEPFAGYTTLIISDESLYTACVEAGLLDFIEHYAIKLIILKCDAYRPASKQQNYDALVINQPILSQENLQAIFQSEQQQVQHAALLNPTKKITSILNKQQTILLVDDVKINRELILSILEGRIDIILEAANGQLAVDIVRQQPVDLVLMDVQMPVMDGLQATKIIRLELENQVPIIGMTAFATEEDKQRCLLLGMNDVLIKPINLNTLELLLAQYLKASKIDETEKEIVILADNIDFPDLKGVDIQVGLQRLGNNKTRYYGLLKVFYKQYYLSGQELLRYFLDKEWLKIQALVHEIKGVAANLAITDLSNSCVTILNDLEHKPLSYDSLTHCLVNLEEVMFSLKYLPVELEPSNVNPKNSVDNAQLRDSLQQLLAETLKQNFQCIQMLEDLNIGSDSLYFERQQALKTALEQFDFKQAHQCVCLWLDEINKFKE